MTDDQIDELIAMLENMRYLTMSEAEKALYQLNKTAHYFLELNNDGR